MKDAEPAGRFSLALINIYVTDVYIDFVRKK